MPSALHKVKLVGGAFSRGIDFCDGQSEDVARRVDYDLWIAVFPLGRSQIQLFSRKTKFHDSAIRNVSVRLSHG